MFSNDEYYEKSYYVLRNGNIYFNTMHSGFYKGHGFCDAKFDTLNNAFRFKEYSRANDFRNAHSKLKSWDIVRVDEEVSVNRKLTKIKDETQAHS